MTIVIGKSVESTACLPVNFEQIPESLTERNQWVLWRLQRRNGNETKVPFTVYGCEAKNNDPRDWATFEQVVTTFNPDKYSGIGFVFSKDDPFVGIDLDGCRDPETGTVADWALREVERFRSYTEISPSGTGVKIWITTDQLPEKGRQKKLKVPEIVPKSPAVECYPSGRYFAMTGQILRGFKSVEHRPDELKALFAKYWPAESVSPSPARSWRSDDAVVERARKYLQRVPPAISGQSGHNATFHAACILTKDFALSDSQAFDVLSEWNQVCQPPWSEHDLKRKISESRKAPGEVGRLRNAGSDRWDRIQVPRYEVTQQGEIVSPPPLTEAYDAMRFVNDHKSTLRWNGARKSWLHWTGSYWQQDQSEFHLRCAQRTMLTLYAESLEADDKASKKWAHEKQTLGHYRAITTLAHHDCYIDNSELDLGTETLNCPNGEVCLKTGELLPHNREAYHTRQCVTAYRPDTQCPTWERFLASVFCEDRELIAFVQRWFGYCLTGNVSEQKMAILWGGGSNGKSTLLNTIRGVIGLDYTLQASPELLLQTKNVNNKAERANLFGKRMAVCVETDKNQKFSENIVKSLTGGDAICCEPKYENPWEFLPTHKLILCTNHKPTVEGTDHGIWRRLMIIPFTQRFEGENIDPTLPDKLSLESEGILSWLVSGCLDWRQNGLNPPATVMAATNEYRDSEDIVGRFVRECCVTGKAFSEPFKSLYAAAERWAEEIGETMPSKKSFGQSIAERGFEALQSNGRVYKGLMVRRDGGTT